MFVVAFFIVNKKLDCNSVTIKIDSVTHEVRLNEYNWLIYECNKDSRVTINEKEITSHVNTNNLNVYTIKCEQIRHNFTEEDSLNIVGHRGSGMNTLDVIENTVESFNKALKIVDWIECDVQLANNTCPVVFHDTLYYDENTNLHFTDALDNVNIDSSRTIATLDHILKNIKQGSGINIEIKYPVTQDLIYRELLSIDEIYQDLSHSSDIQHCVKYEVSVLVDKILEDVINNNYSRIIFSSFSPSVLFYLKSKLSKARLFLITDNLTESLYNFAKALGLSGLVVDNKCFDTVKRDYVNLDMDLYVYDVNSKNDYDKWKEIGAKAYITDCIELLLN